MAKIVRLLLVTGVVFSGQLMAEVTGVYRISAETPIGTMESTMTLNEDGTGTVENALGNAVFTEANIEGNEFEFAMTVNSPMGEMEINYEGRVTGDYVSGNISYAMGGTEFSGIRCKVSC
jgi:hypothetical protein